MSSQATPTVNLLTVTPDDAVDVARLLTILGHPVGPHDVPPRLAAMRAEGGEAWIARDAAGIAVGFASVARHAVIHAAGPVALITALVVHEDARGQGVGRRLVAQAKAWARSHGCARLIVTSAERRADAHAFYPRCGMPYTGRRFTADLQTESQ